MPLKASGKEQRYSFAVGKGLGANAIQSEMRPVF